jgi:hypothetical protein
MCLAFDPLHRSGYELGLRESIEVGPFFSSDGTLLSSRLELERREQRASEILWCWGAYDPRCSPSSPTPDNGPHALGRGLSAAGPATSPRWLRAEPLAIPRAHVLGQARAGVSQRVERPPRA